MNSHTLCYCCSSKSLNHCCGPLLSGAQQAQTPEALMRSRYSAFCTGHIDYLIETTYPAARTKDDRSALNETITGTRWRGLKVIRSSDDGAKGQVEFCAFYSDKQAQHASTAVAQLHELSDFELINKRWRYTRGKPLDPIKMGRNDACFCGSGVKYKKCCA